MDIQATQDGMIIIDKVVNLTQRIQLQIEKITELQQEILDLKDEKHEIRAHVTQAEQQIEQLQKCNANMAEVIEKQSGHLKNLKTKFQGFASFVDMKYNGKPLREWREHLEMVRKAHSNEGGKDTVSGQVANESVS